jgi:hypothetical protein
MRTRSYRPRGVAVIAKELLMGRQADDKLRETGAGRGVAAPLQHGFTERPGALRGALSRIHRWAINSRDRVGLYFHER